MRGAVMRANATKSSNSCVKFFLTRENTLEAAALEEPRWRSRLAFILLTLDCSLVEVDLGRIIDVGLLP
jgi:hypothetical protein